MASEILHRWTVKIHDINHVIRWMPFGCHFLGQEILSVQFFLASLNADNDRSREYKVEYIEYVPYLIGVVL